MTDIIQSLQRSKIYMLIALTIALVSLCVVASSYLPAGIDWHFTYRPATLAFLSGKSPFSVDIYFAAPWALIPLIPFAVLPENIGRGMLFIVGLCAFAYTAHKLGAKPVAMIAFLLSPPVWHCLYNSNIEWLPLLGFVLPPQIGLFFLAIKPQIGIGVALFLLFEAWRLGGLREIIRITWPVTLSLVISFVLYGFWPLRFKETLLLTQAYNASLWPSSIPVGLALLISAIRKHNIRPAAAASPCLSPYVLLHAWSGALVSVTPDIPETVAAVIGLWVLVAIRGLGIA